MTAFDATARQSPVDGRALAGGLRELAFRAQLDIRVDPADEAARTAVESVVGPLPLAPNTVSGGADAAVLWLGPDEWLVYGPADGAQALVSQLVTATDGRDVSVVDVSANRTTLELSGPNAREILQSGCPIDLDPRAFRPGRCAQTLLARANVILWQVSDGPDPVYRLLVRPSFAGYVVAWIEDAAEGVAD